VSGSDCLPQDEHIAVTSGAGCIHERPTLGRRVGRHIFRRPGSQSSVLGINIALLVDKECSPSRMVSDGVSTEDMVCSVVDYRPVNGARPDKHIVVNRLARAAPSHALHFSGTFSNILIVVIEKLRNGQRVKIFGITASANLQMVNVLCPVITLQEIDDAALVAIWLPAY
jgi:hypothetical protein